MSKEKNKRNFLSKIFAKGTNFLNHGEDLHEAATKYEQIFEKYKQLLEVTTRDAMELYNLRKDAFYTLLRFQTYVNALSSCPTIITNGASLAVRKSATIKDAIDAESKEEFKNGSNNNNNGGLLGASAAGGALAIGGPTALMAIATTFGTAGTGVAISSLGGVAATNAALAWIGGGTLAAGGAGVSGGATVLGLMGPIGWGIAGLSAIAFIGVSASNGKKNQETIAEIEKEIQRIKTFMGQLNVARNNIASIKLFTQRHIEAVNDFLIASLNTQSFPNDYALESYPHKELFDITEKAKNLGKMSNQSVEIKK